MAAARGAVSMRSAVVRHEIDVTKAHKQLSRALGLSGAGFAKSMKQFG
jgi:hypothetical protein